VDVDTLRAGNLVVRFLLELAALAAFGYWGVTTAASRVVQVALAIVLPTTMAIVWGLFISPKARFPTRELGRASLGLVVFLLAAAALWGRDRTTLAMTYGCLAVVSSVLVFFLPQRTAVP
jgi:hypothetical protein